MLCKGLPLVAAFGFVIISTPDAKADLCFRYQNTSSGLSSRGEQSFLQKTRANRWRCSRMEVFWALQLVLSALVQLVLPSSFNIPTTVALPTTSSSGICRLQIQNGTLPTVSSTCRGTLAGGTFFHEFNDGIIQVCSGIQVPSGGGGQCIPFKQHHTVEPSTTPNDEPTTVPKK